MRPQDAEVLPGLAAVAGRGRRHRVVVVGDRLDTLPPETAAPATKARELGWGPSRASLVDDFRHGSYRQNQTAPNRQPPRSEEQTMNYALEAQAQGLVDALSNYPPLYEASPADARGLIESVQAPTEPGLEIDESWGTVPADVGEVRVRIVKPKGAAGPLPAILYVHGGGWVIGSAVSHDRLTRELAVGADAAVVFVEYSLAPEAKHPVQLEQSYAAAQWIAREGSGVGLDPSRLAVAGDSAGGNMATVLTLMAKQRGDVQFVLQCLFYPITDAGMDTDSFRTYADGPYITTKTMEWFWDNYLPRPADRLGITASPLRAGLDELRGLPRALIIVDENDVLRDEGEAYAAKLRAAGVPTTSVRYNGIIHDFLMLNALKDTESTRSAMRQTLGALRDAFGHSASSR
jgi:acetyl esterase